MRSAVIAVALGAAGCAVHHAPPALSEFAGDGVTPQESWARVLATRVDDQGRLDFAGLARDQRALRHYVAWIATATEKDEPQIYADPDAKLAFLINAYNALSMYNVLVSGKPPGDQIGFFVLQKFEIAGRYRSLWDFENKVIRREGEPRVHFALNCMSKSCPRLPRTPFEADDLDSRLDAAAREFFNAPRNVEVDAATRHVYLSWIMSFYKDDFLRAAPSLVAYVNRYRDDPVPEEFFVWYLDYDWSLNAAPPQGE